MMLNPNFVHPLSEIIKSTIDGEELDMINSWACGSWIWAEVLGKNPKALSFASEFIGADQAASLLSRCLNGDAATQREAVGAIAFAMEEKAGAVLGNNSGDAT